jgi:hypothetical protein
MKDICAFMLFLCASQIGFVPGSSDQGNMQPDLLGGSALQPPGTQATELPASLKSDLTMMRSVRLEVADEWTRVRGTVDTRDYIHQRGARGNNCSRKTRC